MADLRSKEHGITASTAIANAATAETKDMSNTKMEEDIERVTSPSVDGGKDSMNYDLVDPEVAKYATSGGIEVSEADNKRLRRMIDKRVLSIMVFTYFLQALDKGTLSFTSIMGIKKDLGLNIGQRFAWLTTCIYIAVLVVEYPTNYLIQRLPVAKYLGFSIVAWGAVLACHAACRDFRGIVAVRTLLGIFEAVCQPAFLIMSRLASHPFPLIPSILADPLAACGTNAPSKPTPSHTGT
jgi:Major Facilitator Superfamily